MPMVLGIIALSHIGEAVATARGSHGLRHVALAARVDLSRAIVDSLENNLRSASAFKARVHLTRSRSSLLRFVWELSAWRLLPHPAAFDQVHRLWLRARGRFLIATPA